MLPSFVSSFVYRMVRFGFVRAGFTVREHGLRTWTSCSPSADFSERVWTGSPCCRGGDARRTLSDPNSPKAFALRRGRENRCFASSESNSDADRLVRMRFLRRAAHVMRSTRRSARKRCIVHEPPSLDGASLQLSSAFTEACVGGRYQHPKHASRLNQESICVEVRR